MKNIGFSTSTLILISISIDTQLYTCQLINETQGTSTQAISYNSLSTKTSPITVQKIGLDASTNYNNYLADLVISQVNGTTTTETECTTCTRIISAQPGSGGYVPLPTNSQYTSVRYYLSENDYEAGKTKIKYSVTQTGNPLNTAIYDDITALSGENLFAKIVNNLTATGTYWVNVQFYHDYLFTNDYFYSEGYYFRVGTTTSSLSDIPSWATSSVFSSAIDSLVEASFGDINCDFFTDWGTGMFKCAMLYVYRAVIPPLEQWQSMIETDFNTIKSMPPHGYAFAIWDAFQATTSTTTLLAITHTFPTTSPAGLSGRTFTLDIGEGVSSTLAQISAMNIETIDGDPVEQFLDYWETLWYILFAFWLLHEIFGHFHFELTREKTFEKPQNYQKTGFVRGVKSTRSSGGTSIPIKKG